MVCVEDSIQTMVVVVGEALSLMFAIYHLVILCDILSLICKTVILILHSQASQKFLEIMIKVLSFTQGLSPQLWSYYYWIYSLTHIKHLFIYRLIKGLCSFSTLRPFCSLVRMIVHLASQFLVVLYSYNWGSWINPHYYSVGALSFLSIYNNHYSIETPWEMPPGIPIKESNKCFPTNTLCSEFIGTIWAKKVLAVI